MLNKFRVFSLELGKKTKNYTNSQLTAKRTQNQYGQSLVELIVVTAVAVIVMGALTFATIASLRNAAFSKNQTQATKLAQDGLERMRGLRDRDSDIITLNIPDKSGNPGTISFANVWDYLISRDFCNRGGENSPCLFKFSNGVLTQINSSQDAEGTDLKRYIEIFDRSSCDGISECFKFQKEVRVVVYWLDSSGTHESRLTTILRNVKK